MNTLAENPDPPTISDAVQFLFEDFNFGDDGKRTRLSYRSGARAFLRFNDEYNHLRRSSSVSLLPSCIQADFNAWMQTTRHHRESGENDPWRAPPTRCTGPLFFARSTTGALSLTLLSEKY